MRTSLTSWIKLLVGRLRHEEGQTALEYMAIVVGLILLVFLAFQFIGVNILSFATHFVSSLLNSQL